MEEKEKYSFQDIINLPVIGKEELNPVNNSPSSIRSVEDSGFTNPYKVAEEITMATPSRKAVGSLFEPYGGVQKVDKRLDYEDLYNIPEARAQSQSTGELWKKGLANLAMETALTIPEGFGYMFDFEEIFNAEQQSEEGYTNWFSEIIKDVKDEVEYPVYMTEKAQTGTFSERMSDGTFWASQGKTVGNSLGLMIDAMAVGYLTGGIGAVVAGALGAGIATASVVGAGTSILASAAASRKAESAMEAYGIFEENYNKLKNQGVDDNIARQKAGDAAAITFKSNAPLMLMDMMQFGALTKPGKALIKSLSGFNKSIAGKALNYAGQAITEGAEEGIQYAIGKEATFAVDKGVAPFGDGFGERFEEYLKDPEMQTSMAIGALMGVAFEGVGSIAQKGADSWKQYAEDKTIAALRNDGDALSKIDDKQEAKIIARAYGRNKMDEDLAFYTQMYEAKKNKEDIDPEELQATEKRFKSMSDGFKYFKEADEQLKTEFPEIYKNESVRKAYVATKFEDKKNEDYIAQYSKEKSELESTFTDPRDQVIKTIASMTAGEAAIRNVQNNPLLSKEDKKVKLSLYNNRINTLAQKLDTQIQEVKKEFPDFDIKNYTTPNWKKYVEVTKNLTLAEQQKTDIRRKLAEYEGKTPEDLVVENKKKQTEAAKKADDIVKRGLIKTLNESVNINDIAIGLETIEKTGDVELLKEAKKLVIEKSKSENKPIYGVNNKKRVIEVPLKELPVTDEEYQLYKESKQLTPERKRNLAIKTAKALDLPEFQDERESEMFKDNIQDIQSEMDSLTDEDYTSKEEVDDFFLPEYEEVSPFTQYSEIAEFKKLLNKNLPKEAKIDEIIAPRLQAINSQTNSSNINQLLDEIYEGSVYGREVSNIVQNFITKKNNSIGIKFENINPTIGTEQHESTGTESNKEREIRVVGSIMEYPINSKKETDYSSPFIEHTGEYVLDPLNKEDYDPDYINNKSKHPKQTIEFEVVMQEPNTKRFEEGGYDRVQVVGVVYENGKRYVVTMLQSPNAESYPLSKPVADKLSAIRKDMIDNAMKPENKGKIYRTGYSTVATKQHGVFHQSDKRINPFKVTSLPTIKGKKRVIFGVVRQDKEHGRYIDFNNASPNVDTTGELGATMMLVEASNGTNVPARVYTKKFRWVKEKFPERYKREFDHIKSLLLGLNNETKEVNLNKILDNYVDIGYYVIYDTKGNPIKVQFIKKDIFNKIEKYKRAVKKNKNKDEIDTLKGKLIDAIGVSPEELDALLTGSENVLHAKLSTTKDMSIVIDIKDINSKSPNSVNSKEFEDFIGDLMHQVDVNQINTITKRGKVENDYNKDISELLEVNLPEKDGVTHSPRFIMGEITKGEIVESTSIEIKDTKSKGKGKKTTKVIPQTKAIPSSDTIFSEQDNKENNPKSTLPSISLKDIGKTSNTLEEAPFLDELPSFNEHPLLPEDIFDSPITTGTVEIPGTRAREFRAKRTKNRLVTEENTKQINLEKELNWLSKHLPKEIITEVSETLINIRGRLAWGTFRDNLITIYRKASEGTGYHEGFHAVFDLALTPMQRLSVLNAAANRYKLNSIKDLEEKLADDFAEYIISMEYSGKNLPERIRVFFKRLYNFLKYNLVKGNEIDMLFYNINSGKYRNFNTLNTTIDTKTKPRDLVDKINHIEEQNRIKAFSSIMSGLVDEEMLKEENINKTRLQVINELGLNNIVKRTFDKIVEIYNNDESLTEYQLDQYDIFFDSIAAQDLNSEELTLVEETIDKTFGWLGKLIINDFALSENFKYNIKDNNFSGTDNLTDEEITDTAENVKQVEHWMITITEQARRDKVGAEIRSILSRVKAKDSNGNVIKDDLGFDTHLDYNQSFATLLRELENSTSSEIMMEEFEELLTRMPQYTDMYEKIKGNDILRTKFWVAMQNVHANYMYVLQRYNAQDLSLPSENRRIEYTVMSGNRQHITNTIIDGWKEGIINPLTSIIAKLRNDLNIKGETISNKQFKEESDKLLVKLNNFVYKNNYKDNLKEFSEFITSLGFDITYDELVTLSNSNLKEHFRFPGVIESDLDRFINGYGNYQKPFKSILKFVIEGKVIDKDTGIDSEIKSSARAIGRLRSDYIESSFRNGENKTVYSHILMGYLPKFIAQLKHKSNFKDDELTEDGALNSLITTIGYQRNSWLNDLIYDNKFREEDFNFVMFDSLRLIGEKEGYVYSELTPDKLNVARLNMFYNNGKRGLGYFMVPVLSDTPTNMYIQAKTKSHSDVINDLIGMLSDEYDLIKDSGSIKNVKTLGEKSKNFVLFKDLVDSIGEEKTIKFLDEINKYESENDSINLEKIYNELSEEVTKYLSKVTEDTMNELIEQQVVIKDKKTGKLSSDKITSYAFSETDNFIGNKYGGIEGFVSSYVYNNVLAKANIMMLFVGNPASYKNTEDIYKRMKEIWSPGTRLDTEAVYTLTEEQAKAEGLSDPVIRMGKTYTGIIVNDVEEASTVAEGILKVHLAKNPDSHEAYAIAAKFGYFNKYGVIENKTLKLFDIEEEATKFAESIKSKVLKYSVPPTGKYYFKTGSNNLTDGQSLIRPDRARRLSIGFGKWNDKLQEGYSGLKNGTSTSTILNSLKGFIFGFRNINGQRVPYQVKNSETVLTPDMAYLYKQGEELTVKLPTKEDRESGYVGYISPVLAKNLDYMDRTSYDDTNFVDVIHFNSTIKVGETGLSSLDDIDNATVQTFNNEDYILMQEVDDHYSDSYSNFGVQIRKLIIADLEAVSYNVNGVDIPRQDLIDMYQNIVSADVVTEFIKIEALFPDPEFKNKLNTITNSDELIKLKTEYNNKVQALSERLIKEAIERNLGDEALFGLSTKTNPTTGLREFRIPLFDPIHASRTEALLGSFYKNNVVKQKINGGSLVMVSSVGYADDLSINIDEETGAVKGIECYLPHWSEELFKPYIDAKTGRVDISKIKDKSILNVIGYRIPTEDKYSMLPLVIKGFLPRTAGGIIILPREITTLMGADFDIDKMYMMFPNFKKDKNGDLQKTQLKSNISYEEYGRIKANKKIQDIYNKYKEVIDEAFDKIQRSWIKQSSMLETIQKQKVSKEELSDIIEFKQSLISQSKELSKKIKETSGFLEDVEIGFEETPVETKLLLSLQGYEGDSFDILNQIEQELIGYENEILEIDTLIDSIEDKLKENKVLVSQIKDRVNKRIERQQELIKEKDELIAKREEEIQKIIKENVSKEKFDSLTIYEKNSKEARDNAKQDIIWSVLTSPDTATKLLNPGNFEWISKLAEVIKIKKGGSKELDLLNPTTETKMFEAAMGATKLIGVFANQNVNHAIVQHGNVTLATPITFGDKTYFNLSQLDGEEAVDMSDIPELSEYGYMEPKRISRKLAMMLSAIVDDLKHLNSGPLNINFFTADIMSIMMRLGMPMSTTMAFINQPSIVKLRELSERYGGGREGYNKALAEVREYYKTSMQLESSVLSFKNLWDAIGEHPRNDRRDAIQTLVLSKFDEFKEIEFTIGTLVKAFRSDDTKRKVNLASNEVFRNRVEELLSSKKLKGVKELWDSYPMMKEFYDKAVIGASETLNQFYLYNSPLFRGIKKRIEKNLTGTKRLGEDNINHLNFEIMSALVTQFDFFSPSGTFTGTNGKEFVNEDYYIKQFPTDYNDFINRHKDLVSKFKILKNITFKSADNYAPIARLEHKNTGTLSESDKATLSASWMGLLDYVVTDPKADPLLQQKIRNIGLHLIKYTYFAYGFHMNPSSFSQYIPLEWRENLSTDNVERKSYNDFLESLENLAKSNNSGNFAENLYHQFVRNYAKNRFFVQRFERSESEIKERTKTGHIKIQDNVPVSITLTANKDYDMRIGDKIINGDKFVTFPNYISYQVGKKTYLFQNKTMDAPELIDNPVTGETELVYTKKFVDNATFTIVPTLGIPNYHKEYNPALAFKTSVHEGNKVPGVEEVKKLVETKTSDTDTINIYSTNKNGFEKLSNLLNGPVKSIIDNKELEFQTVEHLYQVKKALFAGDKETANNIFKAKTGWDAQKLGKTIKGLNSKEWDKISSQELESAMRLSFEQNNESRDLLLKTGNNILTHKTNFNLGKWEIEFPRILMNIRSELQTKTSDTTQSTTTTHSTGFQGYRGGFEDKGKGTPEGDGKDKAMREVADGFIGEITGLLSKFDEDEYYLPKNHQSSTNNSFETIRNKFKEGAKTAINFYNYGQNNSQTAYATGDNTIIMLARNKEFKGKPLFEETKDKILTAHEKGVKFVVGDMPNVDSQFIDYLQEIGATFTIYHTGNTSRIKLQSTTTTESKETISKTKVTQEQIDKAVDNLIDGFAIGVVEETTLEELESLRKGSKENLERIKELYKKFCK